MLDRAGQPLAASPREDGAVRVPEVSAPRRELVLAGDPHITWIATTGDGRRQLVVLIPPRAWLPDPPAIIALTIRLDEAEDRLTRIGLVIAAAVVSVAWIGVALELAVGGAAAVLAPLAVPVTFLVARTVLGHSPPVTRDADPAPPADQPPLDADLTQAVRRVEAAFLAQRASENRMRRFVADASHELRTPLTALAGAADVLLRGAKDDPAHAERVARVIDSQAARMLRLVEDLLALAQLDAGTRINQTAVDLDALVAEHAEELELAQPAKTIHVDARSGAMVDGDPDRLRQVLANLTANAARHTRRNGLIEITTHATGDGEAVLAVRDDGDGIAAADLPRIFERFFRADAARGSDGAGLGLAIVNEIVAAHDGHVSAASTPGEGATITVRFPIAASGDHQVNVSRQQALTETMDLPS